MPQKVRHYLGHISYRTHHASNFLTLSNFLSELQYRFSYRINPLKFKVFYSQSVIDKLF